MFRRAAALGMCFTLAAAVTSRAGDILRGGTAAGSRPIGGSGRTSGSGTEAPRQNAKDALARTTQALGAVKAMQAAARQAALKGGNNLGLNPNNPSQILPNVPNGLKPGGLQVAPGVPADLSNPQPGENASLWQGAKLPTQKVVNDHTTVTVEQMKQQALLTWRTFNIGKETTLKFDQSRGGKDKTKWIAVNKIDDPSGSPTQILGAIEAPGQVYIINQNGIMFGGSSRVNLHGLVASTLPINDNLLDRGLLNNPDSQFLFSSLPIASLPITNALPAFTPPAAHTPDGKPGDVIVQPGAQLNAPTTADHIGGRIALVGANVKNQGTISTPDGQTILAAGQQVGFAAHASSDPTLRGLDVFVGAAEAGTGTVTNTGLVTAQRASVTAVGKQVNQLGFIDSSTSVSLNGRIDLLANYGSTVTLVQGKPVIAPTATGTVTLGAGSVQRILPEIADAETVVGSQLALRSQANIQGQVIHMAAGSDLLAPNANVTLSAGTWRPLGGTTTFVYDKGQIYLDAGASVNVAGSIDIPASIAQNILALEMRGSELADSPLQRNGLLRAVQLFIDTRKTGLFNGLPWVGTPLGDASGFLGLVQRTVGQLTTVGGNVKLQAGGSVVMQPGSVVDVSGGWVNFDSGMIQTTRVMVKGQLLDISQATPDRIYDQIYTGQSTFGSAKWNVALTYDHPLALTGAHYETGYTQGADGGSISITAPAMALDGVLRGNTIEGERQRSTRPATSSLAISFQAQDATKPEFNYPAISPTPPAISFGAGTLAAVGPFTLATDGSALPLRADRASQVILSPALLSDQGFGKLTVDNGDGTITVPSGIVLATKPGGSISLSAANLDVAGSIVVPSGSLSLTAFNISPFALSLIRADPNPKTPAPNSGRGILTLADGALLSTAGLVVDDRPGAEGEGTQTLSLDGGKISLNAYTALLQSGSVLDASGGAAANIAGKISYGAGGSISIVAGQDPGTSSVLGGRLQFDAQLSAYSGTRPGSLSVRAPMIQVGGTADNPNTLLLSPDFFSRGGFGSFSLTGVGTATGQVGQYLPGVNITPGTVIQPIVQTWLAQLYRPEDGGLSLIPFTRPDGLRSPVSLAFSAPGATDEFSRVLLVRGAVEMGEGAQILAGPNGSVSLSGGTVDLLGSVSAPGGRITISGASTFASIGGTDTPKITVYVGPHSVLSTAGTTVLTPDVRGFRTGSVLPGGTISISGNIATAAGAVLDVSGTSATLDVHPAYVTASGPNDLVFQVPKTSGLTTPLYNFGLVVPTRIETDGGSITLAGAQELFSDATLLGAAGGTTAAGGKLSISSGKFVPAGTSTPTTPLDVTLVVTQSGNTLPSQFVGSAIGQTVLDNVGAVVPGRGYFAADRFLAGGFDALTLGGTVQFSGPVSIAARRSLTVATNGVIYADSAVNLSAPYVALGTPFIPPLLAEQKAAPFVVGGQPFNFSPTFGAGSLTVRASLIDIGNLSLQGVGKAQFIADGGDIRGDGTLDVAGDIYFRAAQVYPPTAVSFTISALDKNVVVAASTSGNKTVTLASATLPPGFGVGSSLLGSTVTDISGATVTLAAGANATLTSNAALTFDPGSGSVTFDRSGTRSLPLSAGGQLSVYASKIDQGGVLRAPLGTITLGWNGTGTAPKDAITGQNVASTLQLTMGAGSLTSVSAIEPVNGKALLIPYGLELNGSSWIDPTGLDITASGVPGKRINISAVAIDNQQGSVIDIRGGGDLYAYRWVKGLLGSRDILASTGSFAVIPGYGAGYAPYAPFNPTSQATNLGADPGYVNSTLSVGDRIYLAGNDSLSAGVYTLLPARYALLPGAFLVTPTSGSPIGTVKLPDDSWIMSGYRYNDLNNSRDVSALYSRFQIVSGSDVRDRAQYDDFLGNATLRAGAISLGQVPPRLPTDAGQLVIQATTGLTLQGTVKAQGAIGNAQSRGGLVDISSPVDILIAGPGVISSNGELVLNASNLSSFGAESLLIGGIRQTGANGTTVVVNTNNLTVNNAGSALTGPEIILVANKNLTVAPGAEIAQRGTLSGAAENLNLVGSTQITSVGDSLGFARGGSPITFPAGTPGTDRLSATTGGVITRPDGTTTTFAAGGTFTLTAGSTVTLNAAGRISLASGHSSVPITLSDGTLLRVSSDPGAQISRTNVTSSMQPNMTIGAAGQAPVKISGSSVTLDSTYATSLDAGTVLSGKTFNLDSGQISLQLDNPGALQPTTGLVLAGTALQSLQKAQVLSLLSYSSIDVYGTGSVGASSRLELHSGEIRGFNNGGGTVGISAKSLLLDNRANAASLGSITPLGGTLSFAADTIVLGVNQVKIDQFADVNLTATGGILGQGTGGLTVQGNFTAVTPVLTASKQATQSIVAGGALTIAAPTGTSKATVVGGLGASLSLQGTTASLGSKISLQSGILSVRATTGDVVIDGSLDVGGTARTFYDLVKYTNGGQINLTADQGTVRLNSGGELNVAAASAGGDAGKLVISAPTGSVSLGGALKGNAGAGGAGGRFALDTGSLGSFSGLAAALTTGGFTLEQSFRVRTDSSVLLDGSVTTSRFNFSADQGAITVAGTIDAHGKTGGSVNIAAGGGLTLLGSSVLNVAAQDFDNAGKGGAITLETRGNGGGTVDIQSGAQLDLSVASNTAQSAAAGKFTGTLHLRAPQITGNTDVAINSINGTVLGASKILVEGYKVFDLTGTGLIDSTVQANVKASGDAFMGAEGSTSANYTAMLNRLLANNSGLASSVILAPGAEIINRTGDLTLGTTTSTATSDWNLSTFRFGPKNAPGVLTMRASGNLVFFNALTDGFATNVITVSNASGTIKAGQTVTGGNLPGNAIVASVSGDRVTIVAPGTSGLAANTPLTFSLPGETAVTATATANSITHTYTSAMLGNNPLLPDNAEAWSYRLVAGADLNAADFRQVQSGVSSGSLLLGKDAGIAISNPFGSNGLTSNAVGNKYQVIRTGSGDIEIAARRDVQLLNQFATIYTAGTQVADPTLGGTFDLPILNASGANSVLGAVQQPRAYPVQYSLGGGNVSITVGNDITHLTKNTAGVLIADSEREMPTNWLYRRGFVDPVTGQFGVANFGDVASTTWWVDFSNFFEGVGTLGGGNVSLTAGRDVANVDAVAATNARIPKGTPDATKLIELGGGDVTVRAGRDIDAGVYYVERGKGALDAGRSIRTNATRSPSLTNLTNQAPIASENWLPTTLFAGKASFDVSARGDILLGPTANPFLLPGGYNNTFWYKTYFSTYSPDSAVNVASLSGNVTLRQSSTLPVDGLGGDLPLLQTWYENVLLFKPTVPTASFYQPWLRLNETAVAPFSTVSAIMPASLRVTAFSGDINLVGDITLSPSPTGTVDLISAGAVNGLQINGETRIGGVATKAWGSSRINLSDTDPAAVPLSTSPLAYQSVVGTVLGSASTTGATFLDSVNILFRETGAYLGAAGVLQAKQALHAPGVLHTGDPNPVHIYANTGDISGLELFSGKAAQVFAGRDLSDIGLYVQNVSPDDITIVSSGRDIIAYNVNSPLRVKARSTGNALNFGDVALSGDIQISGPGTVEVLAGRNLDLGQGASNTDGTSLGLTTIGNARNPYLQFDGAQIIAGAGIGTSAGLDRSKLNVQQFISDLLASDVFEGYVGELSLAGVTKENFRQLPDEEQATIALRMFYLVLRDAGRGNVDATSLAGADSGSTATGADAGFKAIDTLFPGTYQGDISLTAREIKTKSGGDISLFAPGGSIFVGQDGAAAQALDQGILTESGGNISIFADGDISLGTSRIFTLRGGNEIIWSSNGDIAAGSSAKTVQSAPPTRVLIDPQSGDVQTDLAGLATGGGIGVLATVAGVAPGDVDLIAPNGVVDAGDAGIRSSGNVSIAATAVLNASNVAASGSTSGTPATAVSAPAVAGVSSASNSAAAANNAANDQAAAQRQEKPMAVEESPSVITVEVIGYGGSDPEEEERRRKQQEQQAPATQ